jgi:DmsE family decaheme c-type cytochrome
MRPITFLNIATAFLFAMVLTMRALPLAPIQVAVAAAAETTAVETAPEQSVPARTTARKPVDWVALNTDFTGATFVNDTEICATCHGEYIQAYGATKHAKAFAVSPPATTGNCESCHGPRSKHVEDPSLALRIEEPRAQAAVCLQCHEGGARIGWKAGAHHNGELSCSSCHTVMSQKSDRSLLKTSSAKETCYSCHASVRTDMNKMSHHPVREGRMECASCHNVHGASPGLMVKNTVNETCVSCHTEKRGPFVWEHAPVRESCATCHTPHGSNQRNLLTNKDSFLCLSCHSYGGHINLPRYNRVSNPYGSGCVNCHTSVHGSNHPSGAKLTR